MLRKPLFILCLFLSCGLAQAEESTAPPTRLERYVLGVQEVYTATRTSLEEVLDKGFSLLGMRYRWGGNGAEDGGIDCSGLVRKVFGDALGMNLPRTAAEMAKLGERINKDELKPGDLVFFNTMRRTFSHVGIYLGDDKFLHAPSKRGVVRVEKMDTQYWEKRFNGARRLISEAQAAETPAAALPGARNAP